MVAITADFAQLGLIQLTGLVLHLVYTTQVFQVCVHFSALFQWRALPTIRVSKCRIFEV